jgi:hypothetical protein
MLLYNPFLLAVITVSTNLLHRMYKKRKQNRIDIANTEQFLDEVSKFKYKKNKKKPEVKNKDFFKSFSKEEWYITKNNYKMFLTGLYYLGYEKYSDRIKGQKEGTDQFLEFYMNLIYFIGYYYILTLSKKINLEDDHPLQIAQIQFIKFLDKGSTCIIKNTKSIINVNNYSKKNAEVTTDPKEFKKSLLKCALKKSFNSNTITSMLLFDEGDDDSGHMNTLIISYEKASVWRVEPNIYQFWNPVFNDNLDIALKKYFNNNPELHLTYKGLYPYTLKSTPNHVGLCVMISALQLYLPKKMTDFNVKYYIIKFLEWEYNKIYNEKFDVFKNTNNSLINLIKFTHKFYKINDFEINGKNYTINDIELIKKEYSKNGPTINKIVCKRDTLKNSIIYEKQNPKYLEEYTTPNNQNVFQLIK